ncbi:hypothetical protein BH09VER1_BH09VER1_33790 [soil metagenome]
MGFLRQYGFWLLLFLLLTTRIGARAADTARTRLADGFDQPVGKPDAEGYYTARGFRPRYHMGEDWNGLEGGNKDLGKPVYATANGYVVMARDMRSSWGNLVIIRHAYLEDNQVRVVDSVYAHMDKILIKEDQQVLRGQQVGTIGTAHGLYPAHLHFEIRKNLNIGFNQRGFPRDYTAYYSPGAFIAAHRKLSGSGRSVLVPIHTFTMNGKGEVAPIEAPPSRGGLKWQESAAPNPTATPRKPSPFKVNRFDDLL